MSRKDLPRHSPPCVDGQTTKQPLSAPLQLRQLGEVALQIVRTGHHVVVLDTSPRPITVKILLSIGSVPAAI